MRESFKKENPPAIKGTGYVVESLEAALLAFDRKCSEASPPRPKSGAFVESRAEQSDD
jgi:hypothetical protein